MSDIVGELLLREAELYSQQVLAGSKPVASMQFHSRHLDAVTEQGCYRSAIRGSGHIASCEPWGCTMVVDQELGHRRKGVLLVGY